MGAHRSKPYQPGVRGQLPNRAAHNGANVSDSTEKGCVMRSSEDSELSERGAQTPGVANPAPKKRNVAPKRHRLRARVIAAVALVCCLGVGGAYASFAYALSQSDYSWYQNNPQAEEFVITTAAEMNAFAHLVNGTAQITPDAPVHAAEDFQGKRVVVKAASGGTIWLNVPGTANQTTPIGTGEHPFSGTFDGGGVTVSGMLITESTDSNRGLFGVVGERGSVNNVKVDGQISVTSNAPLSNVGGIVGYCQGSLSGCDSNVKISIENSFQPTVDTPTPLNGIGGVVGRMTGSLSGCTFDATGSLTIKDSQDAIVNETNNALPVALGIGGVAGMFGSSDKATTGITIEGCANSAPMYLSFTGLGGKDRFGTPVVSKAAAVGGVAGYSSGSITNCSNTGELRTSTRGTDSGKPDAYGFNTTYDNGAMQLGGIVGNLRDLIVTNHFQAALEPDHGTKDNQLVVKNCWNKGLVIGSNAVGGIVGTAGTYTLITESANGNYTGNNRVLDGQLNDKNQGAVVCTRWNKPFAGGIVGMSMGSVTFCYNRAQINNTQAGYYLAGIAGALGNEKIGTLETIKQDPSYQCEVHSCWNSGQIGLGHKTSNKFGALVGSNDGFLHDCVVLEGCVIVGAQTDDDDKPTGKPQTGSDAIGNNAWKNYRNITVLTLSDLQQSSGLAILNAYAQEANGFTNYWYSGKGTALDGASYNDEYPVLLSWEQPRGVTDLNTVGLTELSCDFARYNPLKEPVPDVQLATGDGTKLVQNVDYRIEPQAGATAMSVGAVNEKPYRYSVVGIGRYSGVLSEFGKYGIGAGSLEDMSVHVSEPKFNWQVQFPEKVQVLDAAGQEVPTGEYDYVIYDSGTNNLRSRLSSRLVAFDSAGYLSFDGGSTLEPALAAKSKTDGKAFKVYDRDKKLIADSDGGVYDPETEALLTGTIIDSVTSAQLGGISAGVVGGAGLMNYKEKQENQPLDNDCNAGYVVEIQGKGAYAGSSATGRYLIRGADFARDVNITVDYNGQDYKLDTTTQKLYRPGSAGQKLWGMDADFTGEPIRPDIKATYLDKPLTKTVYDFANPDTGSIYTDGTADGDMVLKFGPVSDSSAIEETPYPNRNAADAETAQKKDVAAVTAQYGQGSNVKATKGKVLGVRCFTSYAVGKFNIKGVDISTCDVTASDQATPQDNASISPVQVMLTTSLAAGNPGAQTVVSTLKEGTDYTVSYRDATGTLLSTAPVAKGAYTAVVTPKEPNLTGAAIEKSFSIVDPQTFTASAEPTTWNIGKLMPSLKFTSASGQSLDLTYGVDYTYELYTYGAKQPYKNASTGISLPYLWWNDAITSTQASGTPTTVKIKGLGRFAGMQDVEVPWVITKLDLSTTRDEDWVVEADSINHDYGYDRYSKFGPGLKVSYRGSRVTQLNRGLEFDTKPSEIHAGDTVKLVLEGGSDPRGFFTGEKTLNDRTFTVKPCDLATVTATTMTPRLPDSIAYTGTGIEPIAFDSLRKNQDYGIVYKNNVDAGTASYIVTGKGDYTGVRKGSFVIEPQSLRADNPAFVVQVSDQAYTGGQLTPSVKVQNTSGGEPVTLQAGKDYTVTYGANVEGTGYVYVTGTGNYATPKGQELTGSFSIVKDDQNLSYWVEYVDENGDPVAREKQVSGKKAGDTVEESALAVPHYRLKDASAATQSITLKAGVRNAITFVYAKELTADLSDATVSDAAPQLLEVQTPYLPSGYGNSKFSQVLKAAEGRGLSDSDIYKRYGAEPTFQLTYKGAPLVEGVDYEVSYDSHRNVGSAVATFVGKGRFDGSQTTKTYQIVGYIAHQYSNLNKQKTWDKLTDAQKKEWTDKGLPDDIKVPGWAPGSGWDGVPLTSKFKVYLADGTPVMDSAYTVAAPDPAKVHPVKFTGGSSQGVGNIDPDNMPADTIGLSAKDGSWQADARHTFYTKSPPDDLYDYYRLQADPPSPDILYAGPRTAQVASQWLSSLKVSAVWKNDSPTVTRMLGLSPEQAASLVSLSPVQSTVDPASIVWKADSGVGMAKVTISDAGLRSLWNNTLVKAGLADAAGEGTFKPAVMGLGPKARAYDLTPSKPDGTYDGAYKDVNPGFLASLANGGYVDSPGDIPHGATVSVNGGRPVAATGAPLDITGTLLSVTDAFGGNILSYTDPKIGKDYTVTYEKQAGDGSFSAVDEVKDIGTYRVTVTGGCKSIMANGDAWWKTRYLYVGSASGEFAVSADRSKLDDVLKATEQDIADTQVSATGEDVANGAQYVSQEAHDALNQAILVARQVPADAGQDSVDGAAATLTAAHRTFVSAKATAVVSFKTLQERVDAASGSKDGIVPSVDGGDVSAGLTWATPQNIAALDAEIAAGRKMIEEASVSQVAADAQSASLATAIENFAKVLNTANPSKIDLSRVLQDAAVLRDSAEVSASGLDVPNGHRWVPQAGRNSFDAAIGMARDVYDNAAASQNEVDAAKARLAEATDAFNEACTTASVSYDALDQAVKAALADRSTTVVAAVADEVYVGKTWVVRTDADSFDEVLGRAQDVLREHVLSQQSADSMLEQVKRAQGVFDAAKRQGSKPLPVEAVSVTLDHASGNDVAQATAVISPVGAATDVTWSSSDAAVASVDASGKITPHKDGIAVITATSVADPARSGSANFAAVGMAGVIDLTDAATGVRVLGAPSGTRAVTVDASGNPLTALDAREVMLGAYDVELWVSDAQGKPAAAVQPTSSITVLLPVTLSYAGAPVTVHVYHDIGDEQDFSLAVGSDGYVAVPVDRLSRFEVTADRQASEEAVAQNATNSSNSGSTGDALAPTGDRGLLFAAAGIALAALGGLGLAERRMRQARKR